jgi:hypothetical protein
VRGNVVKVWRISAATGVPTLADSIVIPEVGTVSDIAVTPDGTALVVTTENGPQAGLYIYDRLANAQKPVLKRSVLVGQGLHTGEVAVVGLRTYVFAARNPSNPALLIYDITGVVPFPPD